MFPFVYSEISDHLKTLEDLEKRLLLGGLPNIFTSDNPFDDLDDYLNLYLNEEIKAEGFVRNFEAFNRFLITAALSNAKQVNFTEIGSDSQIPPRTIHDYFQILEDTLIGFMLMPFRETQTRKAVSTAKFYFFDTGVVNALLKRTSISIGTPEAGDLFEHFVISEIRAYNSYKNKKYEMMYWRSTSKFEVDLILKYNEVLIAIEIKSKSHVVAKDFRGLEALSEEYPKMKKIMVTSDGKQYIATNKVEVIPIFLFLKMLWAEEIF